MKTYCILVGNRVMIPQDVKFIEDQKGYPTLKRETGGVLGVLTPSPTEEDERRVEENPAGLEDVVEENREMAVNSEGRLEHRDALLRLRQVLRTQTMQPFEDNNAQMEV
jgi:hypothetical protein